MIPVNEPLLGGNELAYLEECLRTGWISSEGRFIREFEAGWAAYCGMAHGIAVSNGTVALEAAVEALELEPGAEIIMPSFTIISCGQAAVYADTVPVLVDSDPDTWTMDVSQVAAKITPRTRALMPVHIYGHPVDMDPLRALADAHGLRIIEDAAEAHGATYQGRRCGGLGDLSTFSFYANKIITTGEGGMVLTNDAALAEKLRSVRNLAFRKERRFFHTELGHNFRLTNLQAAVGLAQLERVDSAVAHKRWMGAAYTERLNGIPGLQLPVERPWATNVYWMYGVVLDEAVGYDAAAFAQKLAEQGVMTRPFFLGLHEQPAFHARGLFQNEHYPVAERLARQGLYLPSGMTITESQIDQVCRAVRTVLGVPERSKPMTVFGEYAQFYDTLYRDKDYNAEVAYLEQIFSRWGKGPVKRVLDLGCGTGGHALPLVELGYSVTGVDQSAGMLAQAQQKLDSRATFVQGDIRQVNLGQTFDAVVSMFAVMGYMITNADLAAALQTARRHLRPGGLFIFDAWSGPAVLAEQPSDRYKIVDNQGERVIRFVHPEIDVVAHTVAVNYKVLRLRGEAVLAEVDEVHPMRYLFPQEIAYFLTQAGFVIKHLGPFLDLEHNLGPADWNLAVVAEAV